MRDDANKHNLGVTLGDNISPTLSHGIYLSRGGDIFGPAEEIAELERSLQKTKRELQVTQRALEVALEQSVTDPLTGLANRRGIDLKFSATVNTLKRSMRIGSHEHRKPPKIVALMIDIDYFKSVNDRHGHTVGDQMLIVVSNLIGQYFGHRQGEIVGRWGGEEFLVLLPQSSIQYAYDQASLFRSAVERTIIHLASQHKLSVTVSIGIAEVEVVADLNLTSEDIFGYLVRRTDTLLYAAKEQGRNCVLKEKDYRDYR